MLTAAVPSNHVDPGRASFRCMMGEKVSMTAMVPPAWLSM